MDNTLKKIEEKVNNNQRLSFEDGVALFTGHEVLTIGYLENMVR